MKIALVVPGRFHAFDLARALIRRRHAVTVFTNYPAWSAARFGLPRSCLRSHWPHGPLVRTSWWGHLRLGTPYPEPLIYTSFGRWAAHHLGQESWDVIHCWSGVSEELLQQSKGRAVTLLARGSSHIRPQAQLLQEEVARTGLPIDRPSPWLIAREEREYAMADAIVVLSQFAHDSFVAQGVSAARLRRLPLGSQTGLFRPPAEVVDARCQRLLRGEPLRVLYVGALSGRKGAWDLLAIAKGLHREGRSHLRCLGPITAEVQPLLPTLRQVAEVVPAQPQGTLPQWYAQADLFIFPTIEDGYAMVLDQAHAGALPILATTHCAAPEILREGETGWLLPVRRPEAFLERLRWCQQHREALAAMVRRIAQTARLRTWDDVGEDFERLCIAERPDGR